MMTTPSLTSRAIEAFVRYAPLAWVIMQEAKDVRQVREMYENIGLNETSMAMNIAASSTSSSDTNLPPKVEATIATLEILITIAPALTAIISSIINSIQSQRTLRELRRVNKHYSDISSTSINRFTFGDSFPRHIYNFVSMEMATSKQSKYSDVKETSLPQQDPSTTESFFILHPSTQWHPKFARLCEENPLPEGFLGTFTNLDVLIALIQHVLRPAFGPKMLFTILIPNETSSTLLLPQRKKGDTELLMLPRGIGALRFKSELLGTGEPSLCLDLVKLEPATVLEDIALRSAAKSKSKSRFSTVANCYKDVIISTAILGSMVAYMAACATLLAVPFVGVPLACSAWLSGAPRLITGVAKKLKGLDWWKVKVRILGSGEVRLCEREEI